MSLRRIASCFYMTVKIVYSMTFQQEFWKHAESRSGRGILGARRSRARWFGGMHLQPETASDVALNFVI